MPFQIPVTVGRENWWKPAKADCIILASTCPLHWILVILHPSPLILSRPLTICRPTLLIHRHRLASSLQLPIVPRPPSPYDSALRHRLFSDFDKRRSTALLSIFEPQPVTHSGAKLYSRPPPLFLDFVGSPKIKRAQYTNYRLMTW